MIPILNNLYLKQCLRSVFIAINVLTFQQFWRHTFFRRQQHLRHPALPLPTLRTEKTCENWGSNEDRWGWGWGWWIKWWNHWIWPGYVCVFYCFNGFNVFTSWVMLMMIHNFDGELVNYDLGCVYMFLMPQTVGRWFLGGCILTQIFRRGPCWLPRWPRQWIGWQLHCYK